MLHHATRLGRALATILLVLWLVFATIVLVLRYALLPTIGNYRTDIERVATRELGETVHVGAVNASWRGLRPSLTLSDVEIVDGRGIRTFRLPVATAVLSWSTLATLQLRLSSLDLEGVDLVVRRDAEGQIFVAGYPLKRNATPDNRGAEWLLAQREVRIRRGRLTWHDEMIGAGQSTPPPDFTLTGVAFALERTGSRHRAALLATPPDTIAAPIDVRAVIDRPLFAGRLSDPAEWSGEVFANLASGDVTAWRAWLPLPETLDNGRGRLRAWLRFTREGAPAGSFVHRLVERIERPVPLALDRIADVTADIALDDVAVRWGAMGALETAALASVDGRVVATQTANEQHFAARSMTLQPKGTVKVAPTDFTMDRTVGATPADESGKASLGAIDIGVSLGIVPLPLIPPAIAQRLTALNPHGTLERVAVTWTGPVADPRTFVADIGFAKFGVAAQAPTAEAIAKASVVTIGPNNLPRKPRPAFGQPGIDRVDGTLHATRIAAAGAGGPSTTETAIVVSGSDVTVTAPGLFDDPVLKLAHLAAEVGVRIDGADTEVRVGKASADNAEIAATADLVFRHGPKSGGVGENGGRGWIDLDARFLRADVARVPRYLPNIIGEKARAYLAKALVGGRVDSGSLRMLGALERLDLRAQPGALAVPFAASTEDALAGVRDGTGRARITVPAAPKTPAVGRADASAEPVFHAEIKVSDATYLYGPARDPDAPTPGSAPSPSSAASPAVPPLAWPPFDHVAADIVFDQARLIVHARSASFAGFVLQDVMAELPALADPTHVLRVTGRGSGPLQDLVRFINEGPISRWVRHFTDTTRTTGHANLALAVDLPLTHPRDTAVAGTLGFSGNEVALNAVIPPFRQIRGRVDFSDRGLTIDALTAESLGGPLRIDARTGTDGWIDLHANGTIDAAVLHDELKSGSPESRTPAGAALEQFGAVLSGRTRYAGSFRLRNSRVAALADDTPDRPTSTAANARSDLIVESDLEGLAIDLPAPAGKAADVKVPLRVELSRTSSPGSTTADRETVHARLDDRADVHITRHRDAEGQFAVGRADYRIGPGAAAVSGPSGLQIDLPLLDLDAWREAVKKLSAAPPPGDRTVNGEPAMASPKADTRLDALLPAHVQLKVARLRAAGRDFTDVASTADRDPSGWNATIVADQVAGTVAYADISGRTDRRSGVAPASSGRVVARLSKLSVPASESGRTHVDDALEASRQKDFPAIDLVVDNFELRGRALGRLDVLAENVSAGAGREWQLEKLGLTTSEARFVAHGVWGHEDNGPQRTRLDFDLTSTDVGALMDRFGLTRTIANGDAHLFGNASWDGGPTTIDFATLAGDMNLSADKGRFLKADPGIAKLLNILSLQGLARRLTLDFSDVVGAGFAFDTVRADARIDHGIARTDDFTMRGVQAVVRMAGTADLEHETTDLHVVVLPQINAGAASLGLAIVNPAVGLGTFVAQYLFKDRISEALSFEYNVTGPWGKPEVVKIDRKGNVIPVKPKTVAPVAAGATSAR